MSESTGRPQVSGPRERLVAGRYRLVREIGRGGMGVVWLAHDDLLQRQVAVKELRPPAGLTDTARTAQQSRALHEARSAARITHPGAVTLHEVVPATEHDEAVYLIMELIEGPTLEELVGRGGPLPADRVAGYGLQLLDVLEAAHALGIVHRDVKPGNIMVTGDDRVKLADFGIAHTAGDPRLTTSGVLGTQAYMAPERFDPGPITPAADLWSLGATLSYAAEGRGPFDRAGTGATLRAIVIDDLPVPRCEPALAAAITGLLRRDPAERATIEEARAHLQRAAARQPAAEPGGSPVTGPAEVTGPARESRPGWDPAAATGRRSYPAPPESPAPPAKRRRLPGRRTIIAAVAVLAAVAAAVGGVLGLLLNGGGSASAGPSGRPVASSGMAPSGRPTPPGGARSATGPGSTGSATAHPGPSGPGSSPAGGNGVLTLRTTIAAPGGAGADDIAFSADGTMLALYGAGSTTEATLWSTTDGSEIASLPFGTGPSDVAFSPDGQMLAVAERYGGVGLWSIATHQVITNVTDPDVARGLAFSPDGSTLAVADTTGVRLWSVASRAWTATLSVPGGTGQLRTVLFSRNGGTLAAASGSSGDVYVWDVATGGLIGTLAPPSASDPPGLGAWISFRADSSTLVIGSFGTLTTFRGVRFWDISKRTVVSTLAHPGADGVNALAFSPADDYALAVVGANGSIYLWDVQTWKLLDLQPDPGNLEIADVAFSADGATLATLGVNERIYVWNVAGLPTLRRMEV